MTLEHTGSVEDDYAPWYCWEAHIENKPDEQTFPSYMPDRIADVGDFFSIGDGHWLVDNRCGLFTNHNHRTEEYGGNATEGLEAFIEPVDIDDNTAATGVDDVSVTADKNDIGYQDMFWILAPVGGTAFSDDMYFKIPLAPAANLKITSDNVSATPSTTSVSNASPGPVVTWRGTATESIDDPTTLWKFGPAEHEADLAIRVKSMKKRTVKVAFHAIASVVPGVANDAPDLIPSASVLQTKLNEIFGSQINAWFEVTLLQTESIAFDVANDTTTYPGFTFWSGSSHPVAGNRTLDFTAWSNPEVSLVTSNRSANYDIHVYVIGGATPFVTYERSPGSTTELRAVESLIGRADTLEGANYCIIDGDRDARTYDLDGNPTGYILDIKYRSVSAVIHTIAHEIGHIVVGGGHPNEGNEGPAPLVGTDRTKRLMCRGSESDQNSLLLVKKEWDKAEEWLKNRPNGDN